MTIFGLVHICIYTVYYIRCNTRKSYNKYSCIKWQIPTTKYYYIYMSFYVFTMPNSMLLTFDFHFAVFSLMYFYSTQNAFTSISFNCLLSILLFILLFFFCFCFFDFALLYIVCAYLICCVVFAAKSHIVNGIYVCKIINVSFGVLLLLLLLLIKMDFCCCYY